MFLYWCCPYLFLLVTWIVVWVFWVVGFECLLVFCGFLVIILLVIFGLLVSFWVVGLYY